MISQVCALQDEVDILSGFAWKSSQFKSEPLGLPIIRIQNVGTEQSEFVYWDDDFNERFVVKKGDLLLTLSGSFRLAEWNSEKALLNQRILKLTPSSRLDRRFFLHYMQTQLSKIEAMGRHALVNNVSVTDIKNLQIPLPPLTEQKRIAGILDAADALRAKRRAALAELDTLLQSTFLDMFGDPVTNPMGWEINELDTACRKITDGTHDTPPRLTKGVPFITSKNVRPYEFDLSQLDYVSQETHEEIIQRCHPLVGDVLYTNIGVNIGNAVRNTLAFEFSLKNVALIQPRLDVLDSCYLESLLNNDRFKQEVTRRSSQGGAQKFISLKVLRSISVPIPPLDLQQRFASTVESIGSQKARMRSHLAELDTLFASLQSRAFNGEL